MANTKKILVIRNDKLGDFMLAWPTFALLKKQYPGCEITALVPGYTAPMAEQCEWIDRILTDEKDPAHAIRDIIQLAKNIRAHHFDVSISLFSEARTAIALWLTGISTRIGPATKLAQLFLNKRLRQKRSQSLKPEYEYNLDLARYYIELNGDSQAVTLQPPYLRFDSEVITGLKGKYLALYRIPESSGIIIIHPGTGGSAINLSLQQYAKLATAIAGQCEVFFIITCGPGEEEIAGNLSSLLIEVKHCIHQSREGVVEFSQFMLVADVFISGSTGPLHIAGALNMKTAAFYPSRRSATSLRWQTLNDAGKRLCYTAPENNMAAINLQQAATDIVHLLQVTDPETDNS